MVEDTPDDVVFERHNETLWGEHPLGYSILGTRETVGALGIADLRALHTRAYRAPRIVVAAAGNLTHDALIGILLDAGWGDLPAGGGGLPQVPAPTVVAPVERRIERDSQQMHLVFGNPTVRYGDRRRHALMLVSTLLGGGMSSRLFQRVREELGLAYSVHSFQSFMASAGSQGIYVGCAPERADEAVAAVRAELASLAAAGVPAGELAMGKAQLKGQVTLSMESVSSRMYRAATVALYDEPYRPLDEVLARIDAVTAGDVAEVCRDFFAPDAQTIVRLGPS